jgi:hypothetical protein
MHAEIAFGRSLAVLAHPLLAWRILSTRGRLCLAGAYLGASYVTVLIGLLLTGR